MNAAKSNEEHVPIGAIPYEDYGAAWQQQGNIMSMRWENKELIEQLWKNLAFMNPKTYNGKRYLVSTEENGTFKPPINVHGAKTIINQIQSVVNTVGSLSKISQDQALIIVGQVKKTVRSTLVRNRKRYECETYSDMREVMQICTNVVFLQIMRAVQGHESEHSRSNLLERRGDETHRVESKGGGFSLPFGRGRD